MRITYDIALLQLVNFIALIVLFTNLDPEEMPEIVQKMFTTYWLLIVCSVVFGVISGMFRFDGNIVEVISILFVIIKMMCVSIISIKLYSKFRNFKKVTRDSYVVMVTTFSAYLGILILTVLRHI